MEKWTVVTISSNGKVKAYGPYSHIEAGKKYRKITDEARGTALKVHICPLEDKP